VELLVFLAAIGLFLMQLPEAARGKVQSDRPSDGEPRVKPLGAAGDSIDHLDRRHLAGVAGRKEGSPLAMAALPYVGVKDRPSE